MTFHREGYFARIDYPDNFHHPRFPSLRCRPNRRQERNRQQSLGCRISAGSRFQASLAPRQQQLGRNLKPLKISKTLINQRNVLKDTFYREVKGN